MIKYLVLFLLLSLSACYPKPEKQTEKPIGFVIEGTMNQDTVYLITVDNKVSWTKDKSKATRFTSRRQADEIVSSLSQTDKISKSSEGFGMGSNGLGVRSGPFQWNGSSWGLKYD